MRFWISVYLHLYPRATLWGASLRLSWQKVTKNRVNFLGNFPQRLRPKGKPRTESTQRAFAKTLCLLPLLLKSF